MRRPAPAKQARSKRSGLNENYGRELMELHTLGVNGGYTQKDVTEVARVLTGWTLKQPRQGGGFVFDERMHEPGEKRVLGHRIKSSGEKEGREVLHILAHHPSTAKFISTKLAMRFVSDNPPPALVERMTQTFLKKDGDIREVLKTMFHSPEFWAPRVLPRQGENSAGVCGLGGADQRRGSQQRLAAGPAASNPGHAALWRAAADRLFDEGGCLGKFVGAAGANELRAGADRGKAKGVQVDAGQMIGAGASPPEPQGALLALENTLLAGNVSRQTHDTIAAQMNDPKISQRQLDDPARPPNTGVIAGLLLGSPEFQRR